jgi:hypothetical protein
MNYSQYPQAIAPTQLIAPHPHQSTAPPLTLTPAQLLQQQQHPMHRQPHRHRPPSQHGLDDRPSSADPRPATAGPRMMHPPMNRPPTRTGSAPSPNHSPRMAMPGPYMGHPQAMQHMREQSVPVSRETVRVVAPLADHPHGPPPPSAGPFMGLDNPPIPNMPPPSPARPAPPPPVRKIGETPAPTPPIPGTTPGQKLPPHIASLNPAVTKISYLPYVPKTSDTDDDDKKPDEPATELTDLPRLVPADIATLRGVMVRDSAYDTVYRARQARMLQELRTAGRLAWWDRDFAANAGINRRPDRFDVRYPRPPRTDAPRKKGARREGIRMSVPFSRL